MAKHTNVHTARFLKLCFAIFQHYSWKGWFIFNKLFNLTMDMIHLKACYIWVKVFRNGASKICGRQPLKTFKWSRPYHMKFFKGCLPQILLGPFLNTLTHIEQGPVKIIIFFFHFIFFFLNFFFKNWSNLLYF